MRYVETSKADNILYIHEPYYFTVPLEGEGSYWGNTMIILRLGLLDFWNLRTTWELSESYYNPIPFVLA